MKLRLIGFKKNYTETPRQGFVDRVHDKSANTDRFTLMSRLRQLGWEKNKRSSLDSGTIHVVFVS